MSNILAVNPTDSPKIEKKGSSNKVVEKTIQKMDDLSKISVQQFDLSGSWDDGTLKLGQMASSDRIFESGDF